jgi:hypothetical protein
MAMTVSKLNSAIAAWGKRVKKVNKTDAQALLVECACHAFADKNVDPFTRMVNEAESLDRKTMVSWIIKHAPASWNQESGAFKFNKSFEGDFDRDLLMQKSWWLGTPKTTEIKVEIDMLEMLRQFIKRAEKEAALEVEIDGVKSKRKVAHESLLLAITNLANAAEYEA